MSACHLLQNNILKSPRSDNPFKPSLQLPTPLFFVSATADLHQAQLAVAINLQKTLLSI
jgi:hypothetical protein